MSDDTQKRSREAIRVNIKELLAPNITYNEGKANECQKAIDEAKQRLRYHERELDRMQNEIDNPFEAEAKYRKMLNDVS